MESTTQSDSGRFLKNAVTFLFMDLDSPMEDIHRERDILESRPEKAGLFTKSLYVTLSESRKEVKPGNEATISKARRRIDEWTSAYGPPSFEMIAALARFWKVAVTDLIDTPICVNDVIELLRKRVIGQEEYVKALATLFCQSHLNNLRSRRRAEAVKNCIDDPKEYSRLPDPESPVDAVDKGEFQFHNSLLVWGPSGSGKTFAVQQLCELTGQYCITIHCNILVQSGIVGCKIEDYFTDAYIKFNGDLNIIRHLAVIVDECDKPKGNREFGEATYNEMLSMVDNKSEIRFRKSYDRDSDFITIPTCDMMFIFCGCFTGLVQSEEKIGFISHDICQASPKAGREDFIKFGLKPELVSRIHMFSYVDQIREDSFIEYLRSQSSPFLIFKEALNEYGYEAELTEDGMAAIASAAVNLKYSMRDMESLFNQALGDALFVMAPEQGTKLIINADYINQHITTKQADRL